MESPGDLARALRLMVYAADSSVRPDLDPRARQVRECRESLLGLADHLVARSAVPPVTLTRGVAMLASYAPARDADEPAVPLEKLIWWVADGLAGCPPHTWCCPVHSKLEPGQVAWTCGNCGTIVFTEDLAARPQ